MADFSILVDPEFFGPHEYKPNVLVIGDICAVFFDKSGEQWVAFEVSDMDGVHTIYVGSRFFVRMGKESELTLGKELGVTR